MNKKILIISSVVLIIIMVVVALYFITKPVTTGGVMPCGGWDMFGDTVCQCSGKLVKFQCPENALCDAGQNKCYGQCGVCKCYQGPVENGIEVSCENRNLLRICPDEWIDETSWRQVTGHESTSSAEYFFLNGEKRELSEFDMDWLITNCNIQPSIVE
ncbi:MAG: hypothetical protein PHS27_00715 [Candidatus Pacebacteria bacterium]|nr:hypothetical protein [Candidatus Paceibacterota bacterium]